MRCRSVAESSTTNIFLIAIALPRLSHEYCRQRLAPASVNVLIDDIDQLFLSERFVHMLLRARDAPARAIKQSVLARQHDDGRILESFVVLDELAGLITIQPRHHDVDENNV